MNLKDCKIKDYSLDIFRAFAKLVGQRLGISDSKEYKKHVEESCKSIKKALDEFRETIPKDENDRFKWQSSIHGEKGKYEETVYAVYFGQIFIKGLNSFIKAYEEACVGLVMPLKIAKSRNIFKRIFFKNKKQPEITPGERDHVFAMLLKLKRDANKKATEFFDEICAHDEFKHLSKHMPQRFENDETEWDRGEVKIGNETYKLPTEDVRFKNTNSNKNLIVDSKNECYYLRDNNNSLCKLDREGNVIGVVRQGSFGKPLNKVKVHYEDFFGL